MRQYNDRPKIKAPLLVQPSIASVGTLCLTISRCNRKKYNQIAKHGSLDIGRTEITSIGGIDQHSYARTRVIAETTKLATRVF